MSDTIRIDAAQPEWRKRCQAAMLEPDPVKFLKRIAEARTAVLNEIEDNHSRSSDEHQGLHDALKLLRTLREIAEREIEQRSA